MCISPGLTVIFPKSETAMLSTPPSLIASSSAPDLTWDQTRPRWLRGRAMNMQTSTRPREHKQCADNPDAAQLLPNFAEREIETYRSSSSSWTGPIRVSHWARVHHGSRGEVWDKVRHGPGALQLSNKIKMVVVKYCCQLSNKMKMIFAKYCYWLSNKLEIMYLPARTTCATQCTTTSAKQSSTPYRCKTDHQN